MLVAKHRPIAADAMVMQWAFASAAIVLDSFSMYVSVSVAEGIRWSPVYDNFGDPRCPPSIPVGFDMSTHCKNNQMRSLICLVE